MPLSSREIKTAAFTVPFLFSPPSSPAPFFFPPTRGTKMRTNQYSPTYLPRDHNLQKRNPWKNGSVPSFHSFVPWNGRNLCHDRESNETRPYPTAEMKEPAWTCATFSLRANKFFAPTICMHFLPTRKFRVAGTLLTDLFRFRASSPTLPLPTGQNNRNYRRKLVISRCRDFTESVKTGIYIYREREGDRERIERGSRDILRRKEEILSPRRKSKQLSSANIRGRGTCLQGLSKEQIYRRIDSSNESRSHRRLRRSLPPLFIRVHFLKGGSQESWRKMEETRNFINVQII